MRNGEATEEGRTDRKADAIARALLEGIVTGALPVGSILPREEDLAREHGASRSVVREAIKLLEVHRLVHPVRRRGTEVLDPLRSLSPEVVRAMLSPSPGAVDRTMLEGLLEVRALLDVEMSALAAERRTDEDLAALDLALADLARCVHEPALYAVRSLQVGRALSRATKNPLFEMLYTWNELVATDLAPLFEATRPAPEPHLQALTLLVSRVRKRDAEGVRELISAFHAWATPRVLQAAELARSGEDFLAALPTRASPPRPRAKTKAPAKTKASVKPKSPANTKNSAKKKEKQR